MITITNIRAFQSALSYNKRPAGDSLTEASGRAKCIIGTIIVVEQPSSMVLHLS